MEERGKRGKVCEEITGRKNVQENYWKGEEGREKGKGNCEKTGVRRSEREKGV